MENFFRYVKLKYHPIHSLDKIESRLVAETQNLENNDFVELLMFSKKEGVLMTGKRTDDCENNEVNIIVELMILFCR